MEVDAVDADVVGYESIIKDGRAVGYVTSGAYGHCIDKSLAAGYIPTEFAREGEELGAQVFAECWLPLGGQRQICAEGIQITADPVQYDEVLRGRRGWKLQTVNSLGRPFGSSQPGRDPEDGHALRLTIDKRLQRKLVEALAEEVWRTIK